MWNLLFIICVGAPSAQGDVNRWSMGIHKPGGSKVCVSEVDRTPSLFPDFNLKNNNSILNPLTDHETILNIFLFGPKVAEAIDRDEDEEKPSLPVLINQYSGGMRAELFRNVSAVHQPVSLFVMPGRCSLKITKDYMQTAVNAFSIFVHGNLSDILRLPSKFVLASARTISMMKIAHDKMAAAWTVVKEGRMLKEIPVATLEAFRPLFKYVNAREMARLNLTDERILKFIGTHPDLSRHQVGVIASRFIKNNKDWTKLKYLNQMNNLLCGVPMLHMKKLESNAYLQLSHQAFYHIHACDPLQRRFYLKMMTKTQALGKPFSWNARDLSRLGLLLSEISEDDIASVKPQAMAGLTPQVVLEMPVKTLKCISEEQSQYMDQRSMNVMAKKIKLYYDLMEASA